MAKVDDDETRPLRAFAWSNFGVHPPPPVSFNTVWARDNMAMSRSHIKTTYSSDSLPSCNDELAKGYTRSTRARVHTCEFCPSDFFINFWRVLIMTCTWWWNCKIYMSRILLCWLDGNSLRRHVIMQNVALRGNMTVPWTCLLVQYINKTLILDTSLIGLFSWYFY